MKENTKYEKFCELLLEEVKREISPEYLVEIHDVVKNNGIHLDSLTIRGEDQRVSPNFYLENFYQDYCGGSSIAEIAKDIVRLYWDSVKECEGLALDFSFDSCRERIVLRLASGVWNQAILDKVPNIPFMDMVILFYVVVRVDEDGIGSVRVSNQLMEKWEISTESLFRRALENSKKLFPGKIGSLLDVLRERISVGEQEEFPLLFEREFREGYDSPFVITNTYGINGATAILYPETLRQMGKKFGKDYFLLPSSIHEFLAVPSNPGISGDELKYMVKQVNSTCVAKEELLSEKVYYYNVESEKISVWGQNTL